MSLAKDEVIFGENLKKELIKGKDFWYFCTEILGYKENKSFNFKPLTDSHKDLCSFLTDDSCKSKIVLTPRFTLKSSINTIGLSLYLLSKNPNLRILIYSDSAGKAQDFLKDIKNHILGEAPNSKFREIYGAWETNGREGTKWNESQIDIAIKQYSGKEPTIDTGGVEQSKVGKHYDVIMFDDIVSNVNVTTKEQMDKVYECYRDSLSLLIPDGTIIITGTRWHYGDAYGRILADNKTKQNFVEFIRDAETKNEDGSLLYAKVGLDRKFLDYQRGEQGSYKYSCLYRNNPVDDETAIFKHSDFKFFDYYKGFEERMFITCAVDPAGEGEDYTAITVVATDEEKNMYILDAVADHLKPLHIIENIVNLHYKWKFRRLVIEKNFFRGTLEEALIERRKQEDSNPNFKGFGIESVTATRKDSGFNWILALQPKHESGKLYFKGKEINTLPQVFSELAHQMLQFTPSGAKSPHDDLLVSLGMHTLIARAGGKVKEKGAPYSSAAWFEKEYITSLRSNRNYTRYRQVPKMAFS